MLAGQCEDGRGIPAGKFPCPLCGTDHAPRKLEATGSIYFGCPMCGLVWLHPGGRLSREEELAHYRTHENNPADPRYRKFLNRLWEPLKMRLPAGSRGLDYGSGPGPTLHLMAREDGFSCGQYDPFFHPDAEALEKRYDFITCSETAEHFHDPAGEFSRLAGLLRKGGWLGVMTERLQTLESFGNWYYLKDPTHVCFYGDRTFEWIAGNSGFRDPAFIDSRVALLQKA